MRLFCCQAHSSAIVPSTIPSYSIVANSATATGLEWQAPSGGGSGFTLINTTSFSAVSSQSVNDVFSSTYLNYRIIFSLDSSASSEDFFMRLRVAGADNSSADYSWIRAGNTPSTAASVSSSGTSAGATQFAIGAVSGTRTCALSLDIFRPFATDNTNYLGLNNYFDTFANAPLFMVGGSTSVTTSYTGFTFYPGSGTMTGSVRIYGYAN